MDGPCVSILLPVFNGAPFLEAQIESILSQTWTDFELLILDDASTDASWNIIAAFADADARIKPHRAPANRGQEECLRVLVDRPAQPLVMFCDQDDIWLPNKVELLLGAIGDAALAYGPSRLIDTAGNNLGRDLFAAVGAPIQGCDNLEILYSNTVSAHALLAKRAILCPAAFAPPKAGVLFDWRLAAAACYTDGLRFVPGATTLHRLHAGQRNNRALAGGPKKRRSAEVRRQCLSELAGFLAMHPALAADKRALFAALVACIENTHVRSSWHMTDRRMRSAAAEVAVKLCPDRAALAKFNRRVARMARGRLHPATLWSDISRTRRAVLS